MLTLSRLVPAVCVLLLLNAAPALAGDGVIELNHTCATTTGCVAGDSPGYPVTLTAEGSYRLTSDLFVTTARDVLTLGHNVDLDLGGFAVRGPVTCPLGCPAATAGTGITGGAQNSISNGKVRGFGLDGITLGPRAHVTHVRVTEIARHGVSAFSGSLVTENQIGAIGGSGIVFSNSLFGNGPSLYRDNTIGLTGAISVSGGRASGPNA